MHLVADIGGTTSRLALCKPQQTQLSELRKYPNANFSSLRDVIAHYLSEVNASATHACLAVAGPVLGDEVKLTNLPWAFSQAELSKQLGMKVMAVNDFTALAMSVPLLPPDLIQQVGGGSPREHMAISVLGPGTGLGVSGLLWSGSGWTPISGEGGNIQFAPADDTEHAIMKIAQMKRGFVCVEEFLSGRGLVFLYHLICDIGGKRTEELQPEDITRRALSGECAQCVETVNRFCAILGSFAGDMALILGAFGGVYIGGGITPLLGHLFAASQFRERFEAKGRYKEYLSHIPTYMLLSHSQAALMGAAAMLNQQFKN